MCKKGSATPTAAIIQAHYWGHGKSGRNKTEGHSCLYLGTASAVEGRDLSHGRLPAVLQMLLQAATWRFGVRHSACVEQPGSEAEILETQASSAPQVPCSVGEATSSSASVERRSPVATRPSGYRVRCAGCAPLFVEVPPAETVGAFRLRLCQLLTVESGAIDVVHLQLSYRHQQRGLVKLYKADQHEFVCDLIPDRSVINAQCVVPADALHAGPRQANQRELEGLRTESRMLNWEASRLQRELRGLSGLAEKVYRSPQPDVRKLLNDSSAQDEPIREECAAALQQRNVQLRARNAMLVRKHAELEALVHRLGAATQSTDDYSRNWRGPTVCGRIHEMPADGSCLFHALARGLKTAPTAADLRNEICNYLERRPQAIISGKTLQEWILWESGKNNTDYATNMRSEETWGGPLEIAVCSVVRGVNIHVYLEVADGSFQRMCNFDDAGKFATSVVNLVFRPGHYDALEVFDE